MTGLSRCYLSSGGMWAGNYYCYLKNLIGNYTEIFTIVCVYLQK